LHLPEVQVTDQRGAVGVGSHLRDEASVREASDIHSSRVPLRSLANMTSRGPPPRPDADARSRPWRRAVIALLAIALIAQALFLLVGVGVLLVGGATGLELAVFIILGAGTGWVLLWLVSAIVRERVPATRALFALAVPLVDVLLIAFLSTGTLNGSCSGRELAIIDEIAQYPGAAATFEYESSSGSCAASLEVEASPREVLAHYRGELEDDGWTVVIEDVPTESEGEPVTTEQLSANRGRDSFTIALESFSGRTSAAIRVDA
jgi:hypothetical protein